ncbi:aminoacyl-tRNA hydrolase [Vagococcus carniphilus]|uniref:Peptidyl-tRNA hydrolase n=1 Tax=Vagococcus carniphilus TaxID=218144 RepID=A0A430AV81_9ENTE|nr:aminoacyl-tRNA hydrolase [Vagococcus carniphilus]MDT2815270.1 aminoacyl-tRNA hydrolase [Vagococcus carniphilus]MDT2831276.1 aminoacyl-tRNA hydrolase [Vagococcus carniphilus]MDT2832950.1 aminoacyl-tRNA hydrolase [Vagococcus carniphilus]MDT2840390.1 aminoacyl-tRNA hydrolase [Vagococcus carniphilus]MDT2850265.1 aminoacyl-tRNA hydrolase [Vagococcus carniphilus]
MKLIVGLGNPGSKYRATKHNIGFITLDEIAYQEKVEFNKHQFEADIAEFFLNGEKIILAKPQTFMNESGRSVGPLMTYYNVADEDLIVIYDDLDLPIGRIRLREKGSAGGHNGIKSLIAHLGTKEFNRIKVGIDRPKSSQEVVSYVLSTFPKNTHEDMLQSVKLAAEASLYWAEGHDFVNTMNQFNSKK